MASDGTSTIALWADWDDLDASIGGGLTAAEAAPLNTTSADDRREWSLITIDNQTGLFAATRDPTSARDPRGCERLTLSAQFTGADAQPRAARLLSATANRLKELAGVEWAPRR